MKTLQELYKEVMASEKLKKDFIEAVNDKAKVTDFLKVHGCNASFEELKTFFEGMSDGELSDESVGTVAGGIDWEELARKVIKEGEVL